MYKLIADEQGVPLEFVLRLDDTAYIPFDQNNRDYREYLEWLSEGNTPLPADAPLTQQ